MPWWTWPTHKSLARLLAGRGCIPSWQIVGSTAPPNGTLPSCAIIMRIMATKNVKASSGLPFLHCFRLMYVLVSQDVRVGVRGCEYEVDVDLEKRLVDQRCYRTPGEYI